MSTSKDLIALAEGFSAGDLTREMLFSELGDDSLVNTVISMASGDVVDYKRIVGQ
jgi:hypothetical protein